MVYSSYETSFKDYSLKFIRRVYLYMASIRDVAKEAAVHTLHCINLTYKFIT